jgi:hypothetical protein
MLDNKYPNSTPLLWTLIKQWETKLWNILKQGLLQFKKVINYH